MTDDTGRTRSTVVSSDVPEAMVPPMSVHERAVMSTEEFSELYLAEMPRLVWFVMKHGANAVEAADAAQAAFVVAWESREHIHKPRAWLRTVAVREYFRRPASEICVDAIPEHADLIASADAAEIGEQELAVTKVLTELPMKQRQAMAWHYDGFTHEEIAREMGVTEDAVRQNLHRARARLKAALRGGRAEGAAGD